MDGRFDGRKGLQFGNEKLIPIKNPIKIGREYVDVNFSKLVNFNKRGFFNSKFSKEPLGWGLVIKGSTLVRGKLNKAWT